jgi:hypothetical protein
MTHRTAIAFAFVALGLVAADARAQSSSLGIGAGVATPKDQDSTWWVTGNVRLPLGSILALEPEIGYWKRTDTVAGLDVSTEDLQFGGNLLFIIPADRVQLFAGGGAGGHRLKGQIGIGGARITDSETKFGLHILGGLDIKVSSGVSLFGAARYEWIHLNDERTDDLKVTKFYGGFRFGL